MKNERGLTLIEVLASIILLSIVSAIVFQLVINTQHEHVKQVQANQLIQSNTYILKIITKDARTAKQIQQIDHHTVQLTKPSAETITYQFDAATNTLLRNGQPLAKLKAFTMQISNQSLQVSMLNRNNESLATKLYLRGG